MCKTGPNMYHLVLYQFHFEMCFETQSRALVRHLDVQKCSEKRCFVNFDFQIFFAPRWRAIFDLSSGQMAPHPPLHFDPNHWKNLMFRDFSTFLRTLLFFLLTFSSDSFSSVTLLTTVAASVHKSEV